EQAVLGRAEEGEEQLGVEEVRLDRLGIRAHRGPNRTRLDTAGKEGAGGELTAVEPPEDEAEVGRQGPAELLLEGRQLGRGRRRVELDVGPVPVLLDPLDEFANPSMHRG